jgi:putative ABC transport system ATP-binding protein
MALVKADNVRKEFIQGDFTVKALDGISFEVAEGEFTALVGPSGSGKTTLLNAIGALDILTEGTIILDGQDLSKLNSGELSGFRLHKIGFVFQAYNLIPVLTAYENIEFILQLQGMAQVERKERIMKLLNDMDMPDLENRFPRQLSGGQQQRVAVARALISHPRIVLADEPTANLDTKNAELLLDLMEEMNKKTGTTFLFSTHDERIMKRARRLIQLRDGKIAD